MHEILKSYEGKWSDVIEHFREELKSLRSNRANPALVENIIVDYYGTPTPLKQIASITIPEPRQILVDPWDKNILKDIESVLQKNNNNFSVKNDGQSLHISLPSMTEEIRKSTVNILHNKMEESRIVIRKIREEILKKAKTAKENSEISEDDYFAIQKEVQEIVDKNNQIIKELGQDKEKEIMTV